MVTTQKGRLRIAGLVMALALIGAACGGNDDKSSSSSSKDTTSSSADTSGNKASAPGVTEKEITVGLVHTNTGVAAALFKGTDKAFQARIDAENAKGGVNGRTIKVVTEDDTSNPQANLTASQKIVQTANPFVVANISPMTFGAYRYFVDQKVPMLSGGFDGPEYCQPGNEILIPLSGNVACNTPQSTSLAQFMKDKGVTKVGALGYGVSPSSTAAAKKFAAVAAPAVGLGNGYVSTAIPFGGENVGPIILDMKKQGVDGVNLVMDANTNFAVVNAALQNGLDLKAAVMATGYGQELLDQPTTVQTAEKGHVYMSAPIPVELNTTATKAYQATLKKYAGYTGVPGFQWYEGYGVADLLIEGLKKGGKNPTRESFVSGIRTLDNYTIGGLTCSGVDFRLETYGKLITDKESCSYLMRVENGKFVVEKKVTGTLIPGSDKPAP